MNDQISRETQQAMTRYKTGYQLARSLNGLGTIAQLLGLLIIVIGCLLALAAMNGTPYGPVLWIVAFSLIIVGFTLILLGTLVAALGQGIKAQFDAAIHTSPFLNESQKAVTMSLSAISEELQLLRP